MPNEEECWVLRDEEKDKVVRLYHDYIFSIRHYAYVRYCMIDLVVFS